MIGFELLPLSETVHGFTASANDITALGAGVDYPWGDDAAGEMFVIALWRLVDKFIDAWENVERDRALD